MNIVECAVAGTAFRMIVSNDWERNRVETLPTKEPETVHWIAESFRAGDTLFDVGANVGIFAILAAARNPEGTVVAIEPMAATFARLCENILVNEAVNLRPYCVAVGARDGLGMLHVTSLEAASSMHSMAPANLFGEPSVIGTGIGLTTIDSLAAATNVPNLIKIDVDGGEDDVLAGARRTLEDPRLRSVLIEFNWTGDAPHGRRRDQPLLRTGFTPGATGGVYEHGSVRWQNIIYTRL